MKKLFISQPMRGKTDKEIETSREAAIKLASDLIGDDVEILDTFFKGADLSHPLEYLGESIKRLARADVAYFAAGWESARGCKIEHECAVQYGIPCVSVDGDVITLEGLPEVKGV